jgi:hypothetical protein
MEFTGKLDSEARRVSDLVSKIRKDTEFELVAVRRQMQTINAECEAKEVEASSTKLVVQSTVWCRNWQLISRSTDLRLTIPS